MTWLPDMAPFDNDQLVPSGRGIAIGWLSQGRPFPRGEVASGFIDKLNLFLSNSWQPWSYSGVFACELCGAAAQGEDREPPRGPITCSCRRTGSSSSPRSSSFTISRNITMARPRSFAGR
jgi:hypothetical protein